MAYRDLWVPDFDMIQARGDLLLVQWMPILSGILGRRQQTIWLGWVREVLQHQQAPHTAGHSWACRR